MNRRMAAGVALCAVVIAACGSPEDSRHYVELSDGEALSQIQGFPATNNLRRVLEQQGDDAAAEWASQWCEVWDESESEPGLLGSVMTDRFRRDYTTSQEEARALFQTVLQWRCPAAWVEYAEALDELDIER